MDHCANAPPLVFTTATLRLNHRQTVFNDQAKLFGGSHSITRILLALISLLLAAKRPLHICQKPLRSLWDRLKVAFLRIDTLILVSAAYKPLTAPQNFPTFLSRTEAEAINLTPILPWNVKEILRRIFLGRLNNRRSSEVFTPLLFELRQVGINVEDDQAIAAWSGEDTNGLELLRIPLNVQSSLSRRPIFVVRLTER